MEMICAAFWEEWLNASPSGSEWYADGSVVIAISSVGSMRAGGYVLPRRRNGAGARGAGLRLVAARGSAGTGRGGAGKEAPASAAAGLSTRGGSLRPGPARVPAAACSRPAARSTPRAPAHRG